MDVYLIDESKNYTFHFPVNPLDKIYIEKEKRFITVDILDFGEVDIAQNGKKVTEISFNTLFPKEYDSSYCRYSSIPLPSEAISLLEYWKDIEQPIRLIITDFNFNELVSISKFSQEERAGEIGDKYIAITFRSYSEIKIESVENTSTLQDNRSNQSSDFNSEDTVKVTASALNVRSGPGTSYDILGSVSNGTTLRIYSVDGNWADVYWGNHGGYICLDYVVKA
ncbi:hypothetical protein UT300005_05770 [Clostridium sp. CTA-5]